MKKTFLLVVMSVGCSGDVDGQLKKETHQSYETTPTFSDVQHSSTLGENGGGGCSSTMIVLSGDKFVQVPMECDKFWWLKDQGDPGPDKIINPSPVEKSDK